MNLWRRGNIICINLIRARNASSIRHPLDHRCDHDAFAYSMGTQWLSNGHQRSFSHDAIRHDHPSGVYNTTGEKADERLYNVRRMLLPVTSLPLVHSRNDQKAKSVRVTLFVITK